VDYAHGKGVVHRDIKPSNLMLAEGNCVKVADFGIAKLADTEMTQSGVLLGTPSYMSPEQAMGEALDGRSDIFSLGVCAFEMLSGEQPFPGSNVTSILYKLVHVDPIEPAGLEMSGLVPQKWREVFGKVLAKKPEDRYQTAAAFVHDLEFCLGSWFGAAMGEDTILMPPPVAAAPSDTADAQSDGVTVMVPAGAKPPTLGEEGTVLVPALARATTPVPEVDGSTRSIEAMPVGSDEEGTVLVPALARASTPVPEVDGSTRAIEALSTPTSSEQGTPAPCEDEGSTLLIGTVAGSAATMGDEADEATMVLPQARRPRPKLSEPRVGGATIPASRGRAVVRPPANAAATRPGVPLARRPGPTPPPRARTVPRGLLMGAGGLALAVIVVAILAALRWRGTTAEQTGPAAVPSPGGGAVAPTVAVVTEGYLRITTRPTGAEVTINGEPRGSTPLDARLALGLYDVQIALVGYETQARTIELTAARPKSDLDIALERVVPLPKTALADITSTPTGVDVVLDGVTLGATPLSGVELSLGERHLVFSRPGYGGVLRTVKARAGERLTVDVALVPLAVEPTPRPTPVPAVVDAGRIYLPQDVDIPAKKLSGDSPSASEMPRMKRGDRISVTVTFVVDENGEVSNVAVTESQAGERLDRAVNDAVKRWRFAPAVKSGVKVKVRETRKFTYQAG
jgi:TonB family protein